MRSIDGLSDLERLGDITLMKDVARGNMEAFTVLVDRYLDVVSRTAFRIMCDREDSEAVTVKVFESLWYDVLKYDDRFSLEEWLLRKTCLYCRIRIMRRRLLRIAGVTVDVFVRASPVVEEEDDYVTKQAWEIYCRASMHLTPLQIAAFALCGLEDLSEERVSFMTGLTRFRIALALQRGKEKIMDELEKYGKKNDYDRYVGFLKKVADSITDKGKLKDKIMHQVV